MELEVFTTNVELQDIPSYSTNITVEGQLLKLSFLWNERIGKRVLSIKNSSDVVYLQNTILHPNEPLELNSNAVLDDLPYSVTLVKTGDVNKVGNIFNWSKDFILCFSRTVDLDVKKLNVVYGVTTPSTPILPPPTPIPPPPEPDVRLILSDGSEETYITGNQVTLELMYPDVDFENTESATYIEWELYAESVEEMHVYKTVTSIDSNFSKFINLRHLNLIGGGVVGDAAFSGLSNLNSVYIGSYVTSLGSQALAGSQYSTLQIDEGVSHIGEAALVGNQRCNELIIPNSVTSLGAMVAVGWGQPRKLVIGSGLKDIRGDEFSGWGSSGATELILSEGVERIGTVSEYAFQGWQGLELTLPDTVKYVGKSAFYGWNSAQKLTIGANPVVLDNSAFAHWKSDVVLDLGGTTTIGDGTFQGWENTTTPITIPSSVRTIAGSAFLNWYKCQGLTFEEGVTEIGFKGVDDDGTWAGQQSFTNWFEAQYLHLPDSLISTRGSFVNWFLCNDLHIGSGLTTLGGNEWLEGEFTNMGRDTPDFDLVIPDTVVSIIDAFGGANPRSIVLGSGVTEIGNFAYQTYEFYIRALTPPTILESNVLPSARPDITVYVPSIATYVSDEKWANLYNIQTSATRMTLFEEWIPE